MCCLFGIIDNNLNLTAKQRKAIAHSLSIEAMERGIDATGVSYVQNHHITIKKMPKSANKFNFHVGKSAPIIMGHTRMTTQGDGSKNYNNHPFFGHAESDFAFAHNGVLWNDAELKQTMHLPKTEIETDSYVCVQIMEQLGNLNLESIASMSELTQGSYCYTFLDENNNFTFVKGDNPLAIFYFPDYDVYAYASTINILKRGLKHARINLGKALSIEMDNYSILRIHHDGHREKAIITAPKYSYGYGIYNNYVDDEDDYVTQWEEDNHEGWEIFKNDNLYYQLLVMLANRNGLTEDDVIDMMLDGYTMEDVEDILYNWTR